ncbi:leucine-rich repeat flightless-interacting protein 1-like isoform X27 [Cyprinus carpio]|uniref:Leucine-rich repeat flightless-interacting protein 1-like isoform X27 n=1 Tax=Cyprinus carpio TaxID=7962 RepID=A0A9R0A6S2_CYPCA|nr:leucine-rich repeat flightless-interacting protein 1-like isoform X27 [Cyprinus carpio]
MGSQGPGRKRTSSKNGLTGEEDALNVIAKEAEARLAAKRAARAEAREIRMKELERQQKEVSDDEEQMSVGGRSNTRADDRLERDYLEKGSSRASTISGATLTSLGGTSSRRGSGDTSISADTEASIREIKEIHELKDQIQDVEAKHMQNLKELKDSLLEVEEKYRKAMVSNAQLDNEKTNMMYEVDTLKDSLMELEEMLFETRRELEEKCKDLEREKHAHSILQFQFSELKETLKQSEELLTEIRQLRLKQDGYVREISDLQETIEWKNKKIGALERQKEFSDAIRNERDELRDEVVQLKDILKKHGIVLGLDSATNGETEEVGKADQNSQTASAEIREGSSVLGTHQLKVCKDQQQKDLDDGVPGNQQISAEFSSTNAPLEANENGDLGDQMNRGVEQLENRPEEPPSSVGDDKLTATRTKEELKSEEHIPEDSRGNTVELECIVHKDGHLETDQQESECVKPSQVIKQETPLESVSASVHDEPDKPGEAVLDDELKEEPVESSQTEKLAKTQGASASHKKKKKKKKNKQKQKQSDKQENDTKIDDKTETVCSEDNPNQKTEGDLEGNHQEPLENDISKTTMNTDVPHDAKRTSELDGIKTTSANINADDVQDKILLVTDEADLAGISKTISNFDCPKSSNGILSDDLSSNVISNPANNIDEHTEDSTNPDSEAIVLSCDLVSSETETSLPHEPSAQSMDAVEGGVESISCSEDIERSSSEDMKEVKSHLNCEVEEQEENVQNINIDGTTNPENQDDSAHPSSPVMEKVENEAERVIKEQPIDQPMENQLKDSSGAELDQEEIERRDDLDKETLNVPSEKVSDTQDSIEAELYQEKVERQDDLDKETLKAPTEKVSDTQDRIGSELDQEKVERQDHLDKETLKAPTEKVSDTQDSIGSELDQEEVERQDDLDKENLKSQLKKCLILKTVLDQNSTRKRLRDKIIWIKKPLKHQLKKCLILKTVLDQNWTRKRLRDKMIWIKKPLNHQLKKCLILKTVLDQNSTRKRLRDKIIWIKKTLKHLLKKCLIPKTILKQNWTRKRLRDKMIWIKKPLKLLLKKCLIPKTILKQNWTRKRLRDKMIWIKKPLNLLLKKCLIPKTVLDQNWTRKRLRDKMIWIKKTLKCLLKMCLMEAMLTTLL